MFGFRKSYSDMLYSYLNSYHQPSEDKGCYKESLPCVEEITADKVCDYKEEELPCPEKRYVHIWGQVKDCEGNPVENALVKLVKVCHITGKPESVDVANSITDCNGFYQFHIYAEDDKSRYCVIAEKATTCDKSTIYDER